MDFVTIVGLVAGGLTTAAFVPQVVKVWRSRSTGDISFWMWLMLCAGISLWIVYGLYTRSIPVIAANAVTLVLAGTVLGFKLRYR